MCYELKRLNEWVKSTLPPAKLLPHQPSTGQLHEWRDFVRSEKSQVCDTILAKALPMNDQEAERYVQHNQKAIIVLSEAIFDFRTGHARRHPKLLLDFYDWVSLQLDSMLEELNQFYPTYLDRNIQITYTFATRLQAQLLRRHRKIAVLLWHHDTDKELIKIIFGDILDFMYNRRRKVSYHVVAYYEVVLQSLSDLTPDDFIRDADCKVHEILIALNYNNPAYVKYYTGLISSVEGIFQRVPDKIDRIYWYRKMIRQYSSSPGLSFIPGAPSLATQLSAWLDEELAYFQTRLQMEAMSGNGNGDTRFSGKIRVYLSVAELAVLLNVLFKLEVIKKMKYMEVLRIVTETYSTTGTEEISIKSLRAKSYSQDPAAVQNIRNLLLNGAALLSK